MLRMVPLPRRRRQGRNLRRRFDNPSVHGARVQHSMTAAIELRGLTKVFGEGAEAIHAFGPADLAIEEGDFVSVLGPSGCGKSTLMLIVAGLIAPSTGEVRVSGTK